MVEAYNFLASWQLFPEKGTYEIGDRPKSAIYKIELGSASKQLSVSRSWVSIEDHSFTSQYSSLADGKENSLSDSSDGDSIKINMIDSITFETFFLKNGEMVSSVLHEITPKGYLQITQKFFNDQKTFTNVEVYHKQMSVLPYSSSVSGAVIRPTQEGVIRNKGLRSSKVCKTQSVNKLH